jgi:CBS-domain-containing membrane protein
MKVKDVMTPLKDCLKPEQSLKEAVNLFKGADRENNGAGVMALPVLDEQGKLIGILSMTDILRAVYPSYMSMMNLGEFTWDGMLESLACAAGNKKVADLMARSVVTVLEDDPLMECVDHILKEHVHKLPVVDKKGKLTGMIYLRDIFFVITKAMHDERCKG